MITIELAPTIVSLPNQVYNAYAYYEMKNGDCRIYLCDEDNKLYTYVKNYTGDIIENAYNADIPFEDLLDELELG